MDKKLYRVQVVLYVMAEDEFDARWAATNARFDIFECTAEKAESIDPGWEDAVPYNADNAHTCAEVFVRKTKPSRSSGAWRGKPVSSSRMGKAIIQPEYQPSTQRINNQ